MAIEGEGAAATGKPANSRLNVEVAGGLFLIGLAIVGFIDTYSLKFGQMSGVGPGLMPRESANLCRAASVVAASNGSQAANTSDTPRSKSALPGFFRTDSIASGS